MRTVNLIVTALVVCQALVGCSRYEDDVRREPQVSSSDQLLEKLLAEAGAELQVAENSLTKARSDHDEFRAVLSGDLDLHRLLLSTSLSGGSVETALDAMRDSNALARTRLVGIGNQEREERLLHLGEAIVLAKMVQCTAKSVSLARDLALGSETAVYAHSACSGSVLLANSKIVSRASSEDMTFSRQFGYLFRTQNSLSHAVIGSIEPVVRLRSKRSCAARQ
ncbi:MAG: hypothetical protein ABIJ46_00090 [bacterium]